MLNPDIKALLSKENDTFQSSDMRCLAVNLKYLDGFICCDTGSIHLAGAGATCIGLYTETALKTYGVVGENSMNIDNIYEIDDATIYDKLKHIPSQ